MSQQQTGVEMIAAERQRVIAVEGYTPEHDSRRREWPGGEYDLADAAACYAMAGHRRAIGLGDESSSIWPWDKQFWKPTPDDRIRELVKAGQLIAAQIDYLIAEASR